MSKHTPGPWKTRRGYIDEEQVEVYPLNSKVKRPALPSEIATVSDAYPEMRANARLIAAAPDLLEACKAMRDARADSYNEIVAGMEKIEAAIAKAEGIQ